MFQTIKTRLVEKKNLSKNIWLLKFSLIEPKNFSFSAGQYMTISLNDQLGKPVSRAYSIATSPEITNFFELVIQFVPNGVASSYFSNLKINNEVVFRGPAGIFGVKNSSKNIVFLVTGTGIAPVLSILPYLLKNSFYQVSLFWGLQTKDNVYLLDRLVNLEKTYKNFGFKICLSKKTGVEDGNFASGRINEVYKKNFEKFGYESFDHYICGSRDIVFSLNEFLTTLNLPKNQVYFEKF